MAELTEAEIIEVRRMLELFPTLEAKFPTTALTSPLEGHVHNRIILETGDGAPSHTAPEGTNYWDKTDNVEYVNNDGGTGWTTIGGSGTAGNHTLDDASHTDVNAMFENTGDLLRRIAGGRWDRLALGGSGTYLRSDGTDPGFASLQDADLPTHGNDRHDEANWVIYVPLGSDPFGVVLS